jgi:ribonuclease P protein subunit POP4
MITQQNVVNHELVGLDAQILESTNKTFIGLFGKVIDETKSMLVIDTKRGTKMVSKQHNKWKFTLGDQDFTIDGNMISKRPEDRIKVKA